MKISVNCCLCEARYETEVEPPTGWDHRYGAIDNEGDAFCPKHAPVAEFAASQCPGCVGGWGDCPMWQAFAYSHGRDITDDEFKKIESGVCPRRVNGTIGVRVGRKPTIEDLDLSDRATAAAGVAFAQAIREYCAKYPAAPR